MRILELVILTILLTACKPGQTPPGDSSAFVGTWVGSGRFYDVKFNEEYGPLTFEIEVSGDGLITGTAGDAVFSSYKLVRTRGRIDLLTTLEGKIDRDRESDKNRIEFLMVEIETNKITGDFHLKSNPIFDVSMRPGEFTLSRRDE